MRQKSLTSAPSLILKKKKKNCSEDLFFKKNFSFGGGNVALVQKIFQ